MPLGDTARLIAELELKDKFSGPARNITGSLGRMERGFSQMGRGVGQVGSGLATLGTRAAIAAAGGLTAVITTAASFEQAFTGVEKTVAGTDAQLAELEETVRGMARTIPLSFEELSGIGEAGGALGIAREDLEEFIDVVARLSVSTNLTSESAATALGQLGTVLDLTGGEFEEFADSLVALGNAGASTEAQIVEIAARFAAAGNSAGLTKEEILALASATASMGIEVEAAGSSLSRIFNSVATNIGTSSAKAVVFADTLGLSAAQFREAWEKDALGTFQEFLGELAKLDQFEQANVLKGIGITGVRDVNAVKLMTQNLGFFGEQLEISRSATGALDKESQKFFDTTVGQWIILKNNVRDVGATIGAELLPNVNELSKEFVDFLQLDTTQGGIKQFAEGLADGIKSLVAELKGTDFSGIIGGMKLAATVARGAFDAFNALPGPVKQLAIAALVANKVSGGAIGQIAGGLGNIVGGVIRVAFPKLDIFGRGSIANPMFVSVIGGIPGVGGAGGVAGAAGRGRVAGALGGIARFVLGPVSAVIIGAEIAAAVNAAIIGPAKKFEEEQFTAVLDSKDTDRLVEGLDTLNKTWEDADVGESAALLLSHLPFIGDALGHIGPVLDEQKAAIIAQLEGQGFTRAQIDSMLYKLDQQREQDLGFDGRAGSTTEKQTDILGEAAREARANADLEVDLLRDAKADRLAGAAAITAAIRGNKPATAAEFADIMAQDSKLSDQKLIDALVEQGKPLTAEQLIEALGRTSEFGRVGVGTSIEVGKTTGEDPFGQVALALFELAKNPKAPEVLYEIKNHIIAAEEIQAQYLADGNTNAATQTQVTIDGLHELIGSEDANTAALDAAIRSTAGGTQSYLSNIQNQSYLQSGKLDALNAKDFSPTANITILVSTYVNASLVAEQVRQQQISVGFGSGHGGPIPIP